MQLFLHLVKWVFKIHYFAFLQNSQWLHCYCWHWQLSTPATTMRLLFLTIVFFLCPFLCPLFCFCNSKAKIRNKGNNFGMWLAPMCQLQHKPPACILLALLAFHCVLSPSLMWLTVFCPHHKNSKNKASSWLIVTAPSPSTKQNKKLYHNLGSLSVSNCRRMPNIGPKPIILHCWKTFDLNLLNLGPIELNAFIQNSIGERYRVKSW